MMKKHCLLLIVVLIFTPHLFADEAQANVDEGIVLFHHVLVRFTLESLPKFEFLLFSQLYINSGLYVFSGVAHNVFYDANSSSVEPELGMEDQNYDLLVCLISVFAEIVWDAPYNTYSSVYNDWYDHYTDDRFFHDPVFARQRNESFNRWLGGYNKYTKE